MIYLPFKNLKNFTERGQKKFKKIIAQIKKSVGKYV